jgi:hypothetical protein
VQRVSQKYLDTTKLTTVMVCDPAAVKPQLEGVPLGRIQVRPTAPAGGSAKTSANPSAR